MKKITKIIISFAIFVLVTFAIDISCKKYCPEGFSCNLADSLVLLFSKIANPMLALFTILTVFIAWETWKTYEKQLSEIKQTNTLQLQPYFGFVSANVTWQYHTSESPQITVLLRIKNTGATSAINISNFKVSSLDFHAFPLNPTIDNNDYGIPLFLDNDFKQGWEGIEGLFGNYLPLHVDNI